MPSAEQVVARLKEAGFSQKQETEHVRIFRRYTDGKVERVQVQRKRVLDEKTVRALLRQAGLTAEQITEFFRVCNS